MVESRNSTINEMKSKRRQPDAKAVSEGFWQWFVNVSPQMESILDSGDCAKLVALVSSKVEVYVPGLGWEIGPGILKPYAFSFSLNGKLENLKAAIHAVNSAPQLPNWEINAGRPPKKWSGEFTMTNRLGETVNVNSSHWKYLLTGYNSNEFFDIELFTDLKKMDDTAKLEAVTIALQGYLGELIFLRRIGSVKLIKKVDRDRLSEITDLHHLPMHLKSLGHECDAGHGG
jgi:hypothetical protein